MSRKLYKQDFFEMATGGYFRADGGDFVFDNVLKVFEEAEKIGPIEVEMLDVDELDDNAYGLCATKLGALGDDSSELSCADLYYSFEAMRELTEKEGKKISFVFTLEFGGYPIAGAAYLAMKTGLPLVDADMCGRSVPSLENLLPVAYGYRMTPIVYATPIGDIITVQPADPKDITTLETVGRYLCQPYGILGYSMPALSGAAIKDCFVLGGWSQCQRIGKTLLDCKAKGEDPVKKVLEIVDAKEICRGAVESKDFITKIGFDYGLSVIRAGGKKYTLRLQNENIAVEDENGKLLITAPDSICLIDLKTGLATTNAQLEKGMEVSVIGIRASEPWRRIPEALAVWKGIYKNVGLEGIEAMEYSLK